jgi:predicted transcriptional regulator
MAEEQTPTDVRRDLVATIVSGYVKHNTVSANELSNIIASRIKP